MKPASAAAGPAKIFLVEDHPIVRHGLAALIADETDLDICGQCDNVYDALQQITAQRPHLAVIDISLNGGSGLDLIKQLKARRNPVLTLVVSMHDEILYAERVVRAGARGYLSKSQATAHFVTAIRQVLAGKLYLSPAVAERVLQRLTPHHPAGGVAPLEVLSDRELEVFGLLGRGLSTRAIAGQLHLSVKTISTYRETIKRKLSLANTNELICRAVEWTAEQPALTPPAPPPIQQCLPGLD